MKIIHTADWHLGKILNGKSLLEDQIYILKQFIDQMLIEKPDIIVVAGDLYDTSYPSKDAIKLLEQTIYQLNIELKIPMIIINGNHDSKERLNYGSPWFQLSNLHIKTSLEDLTCPITFGNIKFYTMPYATVSEVAHFFDDETIQTHQQATEKCLEIMSNKLNKQNINIIIGHLTIQGGKKSDSERPLTIGTVESVNKKVFEAFDKVLLGHLHNPFSINDDKVNYSGSLLQYSFSEVGQAKGYRVIEIDTNSKIQDTFKQLQPLKELEVVEGQYNQVIAEEIAVKNKNNYFHFKLKGMSHITDPMIHLKKIYPNTLALTNISYQTDDVTTRHAITKLKDEDIISEFYKEMTNEPLTNVQSQKVEYILNHLLTKED